MLRKLSILSFLIIYLLLFNYTLISRSSYIQIGIQSKASAYSSLGLHLLSLQYKPSSINIRSIILLAVPCCHIIAPREVASLRPQVSIAFSRHSTYRLAAIQIPPYRGWQRFISPSRIDSMPSVSSKLIADIIFAIYGTPSTLGLYTLIIYTGPLYIWIVITAISRLTACYNYKDRLIALLIIKHTRIAAFGLYRSWYPQGQYVNYMQALQYGSYIVRIQYFSRSRLSSKGLIRRWFVLPQLYYIMDRWRTPGGGPSPLLRSSLPLFPLSLGYLELLSLVSAFWLLLILCGAFYSRVLCSQQRFYI